MLIALYFVHVHISMCYVLICIMINEMLCERAIYIYISSKINMKHLINLEKAVYIITRYIVEVYIELYSVTHH